MEKQKKEERVRKEKKTEPLKDRKGNCRGSYITGSACADCTRCETRYFDAAKKKEVMAVEKARTDKLPAGRVKPKK